MNVTSLGRRTAAVIAVGALTLGRAAAVNAAPPFGGGSAAASSNTVHPDAGQLAGDLLNQELAWEGCEFPGLDPVTQAALQETEGLTCADIVVPRDWNNPNDGETISLRVSVTDTADPERSQGIAPVNPGHPRGTRRIGRIAPALGRSHGHALPQPG